jgi:hypothetical protein
MRRILAFVVLLTAMTALTGCRGAGWFVGGALVGAAIASHHDQEVVYVEPHYVVVSEPYVYVPPPPPPAREAPEGPAGPKFDAPAARSALDAVDLAECRAQGAPRGYGHARVTFAEGGNVTKVIVDSPAGLPAEAVSCVGQRLATASVPPFDGVPVTVGKTWLVR